MAVTVAAITTTTASTILFAITITTATATITANLVAISGVEPPLEERSRDDVMTSSRRVDDGVDYGRSSLLQISEIGRQDLNNERYTTLLSEHTSVDGSEIAT